MDKINSESLGNSILILVIALILRLVATYGSVSGGDMNRKEKLFMSIAWMPKATVQAVLGPLFLSKVVSITDISYWDTEINKENWRLSNPEANISNWDPLIVKQEWEEWGKNILTIAVLSILITAPFGAVLISSLGPKLLEADESLIDDTSEEDE